MRTKYFFNALTVHVSRNIIYDWIKYIFDRYILHTKSLIRRLFPSTRMLS